MRLRLHVVVFLLFAATLAAAQDVPRGAIVDKVVCRAAPGQSYALYLPSGYSPDAQWPILYALDPGARGRLPVDRFKDAAEKLGFIVAGSNNSRNGPMEASQAAINAILTDTTSRFSLDARRVYFTGFSGGARVAVAAGAAMAGRVAGVIGFGAGFPPTMPPSASVAFAYFAAAGTDDFNYPELLVVDRRLEELKLPHRFLVFEGGHEWPSEAICARALEWMEIQAMRSGRRTRDPGHTEEMFAASAADAAAEEQAGRAYLAAGRYEAIASDFAQLHDVSTCEQKARQLAQSKEVRDARAALKESVGVQETLSAGMQRRVLAALTGDDTFAGTSELLSEAARIKKQADTARRPADRMAARRVVTSTWIWLNEGVDADFERGNFSLAATRLRVMSQLRPESANVEVRLARACTRAGNRKQAIDAIGRAIAKGFTDADALEKEPDLAALRQEPAFREILARLRAGRDAMASPPRLATPPC